MTSPTKVKLNLFCLAALALVVLVGSPASGSEWAPGAGAGAGAPGAGAVAGVGVEDESASRSATAQTPAATPRTLPKGRIFTLGLGGEMGYVHVFQDHPSGAPRWDLSGKEGPGLGGGLLLSTRFYRFVGLEGGLLFDHASRSKHHTFRAISPHGQVRFQRFPTVTTNNMRIPIMLKLIAPITARGREAGNIWISCGPEWIRPLSVYGSMPWEIMGPANIRYNERELEMMGVTSQEAYLKRLKEREAVHLALGLGFNINVGASEVGVGVKASWNYNHDNQYTDAFCINEDPATCVGEEFEYSDHTLDIRAVVRVLFNIPVM